MHRYVRPALAAVMVLAGLAAFTRPALASNICTGQADCHVLTVKVAGIGCRVHLSRAADGEDAPAYADYSSSDLPAEFPVHHGAYRLRIGDTWYGGGSFATAKTLSMKTDTTVRFTDCDQGRPHYVTEVLNANGQPIPYVRLISYGTNDPTQVQCRHTSTGYSDGYATHNFGCGSKVLAIDPTGRYRATWADGAATFHDSAGQDWRTDGVIQMSRVEPLEPYRPGHGDAAATLVGELTRADDTYVHGSPYLGGLDVQVYRAADDTSRVARGGGFGGEFRIRDLDTGDYKLKFADGLWYGGETFAAATTLHLAAGDNRIDWTLPHSGSFEGRVVDSLGGLPGGVLVTARDVDDGTVVARTTTYDHDGPGEGGDFRFDGLPSHDYVFEVTDAEGRFLTRWYGDAAVRGQARVYPTVDGAVTDLGTLVLPTGLTARTAPTISGTNAVGKTLRVTGNGTWTQTGLRFRYQWFRNGVALPGETRASFVIRTRHQGGTFGVVVTASRTGYPDATGASRETGPFRW